MGSARQAWADLSPPWRAAFDEAWLSWRQGSLAVGAVVVDGDGEIVARGHNQLFHAGPGPISSTPMAHAEMNALARLPVGRGRALSVYSSFEPCAMCTGALLFYGIEHIAFACADPVWAGMDEWLLSAPWSARHRCGRACLGGALGAFGCVLHVSRLAGIAPRHVLEAYERTARPLFDFATEPRLAARLADLAAGGEPAATEDVVTDLWTDLVRLAPSPRPPAGSDEVPDTAITPPA
jgi:tRNA(adenine34) deaminase